MKCICINFQIHHPFRLRHYPFFEIGDESDYFSETANITVLKSAAKQCYTPANQILLELIQKYGDGFKVSFSISGTALDLFERYMPELILSFQALARTGKVEFLGETYAHSLSAMISRTEFSRQVKAHVAKIASLFGQAPASFRNTCPIYADFIGDIVYEMGFNILLTEGPDNLLEGKSPNYLYSSSSSPDLKLLFINRGLSEDIALRFSDKGWKEWPLTAEKFTHWLQQNPKEDQIVNLFMDYETFGVHQKAETGIFDFLKDLPEKALRSSMQFVTPSEAGFSPTVGNLSVPHPMSGENEEKNGSEWMGNYMQKDAFHMLYALEEKVHSCKNAALKRDWLYLQSSDHFYYMCTKFFAEGNNNKSINPYNTPFDAYINYMNVLSDFSLRLEKHLEKQIMSVSGGMPNKETG